MRQARIWTLIVFFILIILIGCTGNGEGFWPSKATLSPTRTCRPTNTPLQGNQLLAQTPSITPVGNNTAPAGDWVQVWGDEFTGPVVDLSRWNVLEGPDGLNNDLNFNLPENIYIENGMLVLRQTLLPVDQWKAYDDLAYTTGKVNTQGKFHFQYGRIEIRASTPEGNGFHSALWLMRADGIWPSEIDISEILGQDPRLNYMTYHWGSWPDVGGKMNSMYLSDDQFHVFAVEWEPQEIRWYVDGELRASVTERVEEARVPMILIMDTVIGGNWPKPPNEMTVFPNYRKIDYVRIYQRASMVTPSPTPDPDATATNTPQPTPTRTGSPTPDLNTPTVTATPYGTLLSQGKPVTASSVESPLVAVAYVNDGDLKTRWGSAYSDPQWVTIDLGESHLISRVNLKWETAYAKAYEIQVSEDNVGWVTVYCTEQGDGSRDDVTGIDENGRYVRIYGTRRGTLYGYSLWEFDVYGE